MEERYHLKRPESFRKRKRVGCGISAGKGKTCGRGQNGQLSRSGTKKRAWFEGGQMPLQRRVPKRGFNNYAKKEFQVINCTTLDRLGLKEVDPDVLKQKGIISHVDRRIKILGAGEIKKPVKVIADAFSKSAEEKIKKAGGEVVIREFPPKKKKEESMES